MCVREGRESEGGREREKGIASHSKIWEKSVIDSIKITCRIFGTRKAKIWYAAKISVFKFMNNHMLHSKLLADTGERQPNVYCKLYFLQYQQWELIALNRQGKQQQRHIYPPFQTHSSTQVRTKIHILSLSGYTLIVRIYLHCQAHSATETCTGIRHNQCLFKIEHSPLVLETGSTYKHTPTHIYMLASERIFVIWNRMRPV